MPDSSGTAHSSFSEPMGGTEHFIGITASPGASFEEQVADIDQRYKEKMGALDLEPDTAVFRRLFVSDVMNQAESLTKSGLASDTPENPVAVSIVQQPPLSGSKVSMLAYHLESGSPVQKHRLSKRHVLVEKNEQQHLWSTRLCASDDHGTYSAADQTRRVFDDLIGTLEQQGGTLSEDCVRTWIYVKDVDVFYQDMVDSRRDLFANHGLTGDTHYIASTGIEGACAHRHDLVAMDAYSVPGLKQEQVSYLNDFDRLCLTKDYNVTFERGTRVAYADRSHYFISGTASIDRDGEVVHRGDVMRQLDRTLENIDALLLSGDASLGDMKYLIVYLRDPADYAAVEKHLSAEFPGLPVFVVVGAVCRPEWLIEIEGVGIGRNDAPNLPSF